MTTNSMKGLASRKLAVEVLIKVEKDSAYATPALATAFKNHALQERDRAFVTYIVQGTLRHQLELDEEISKFSSKPLSKLTPALRAILRSSIFQMLHMEDMPASAVINTAVEIARKTGHEGSAKFANAVLRSFDRKNKEEGSAREAGGDAPPLPNIGAGIASAVEQDPADFANGRGAPCAPSDHDKSKKYSLPDWILKHWRARFSEEEVQQLLKQTQEIPKLILRTCEMSISPEGLIKIFENKGMRVERSLIAPSCLRVIERGETSGPINKLPGYSDGLFAVMDDASALVSIVLDPQPGQTIIDLCAAPGGKSVHLGELMQNKGRVVAVDSSAKRLSLLASERRRLGLQNIETVVEDGRTYRPEAEADAVLVDSPCSGTGVMNRRSDLRVHREESHIASLVSTQRALLENAAKMVKPGGVLVYSTCSIEPEENEENLSWFLQNHPEYRPGSLERFFSAELLQRWAGENHWEETHKQLTSGYVQLLPSRHACSGFFISRLERKS